MTNFDFLLSSPDFAIFGEAAALPQTILYKKSGAMPEILVDLVIQRGLEKLETCKTLDAAILWMRCYNG